jgi:hypothetical protein
MTECCICKTNLPKTRRETSNITQLSCGHELHASCILRWLKESNSCPYCRVQVIPTIVHVNVPAQTPYTEELARYFWLTLEYSRMLLFFIFSLASIYFLYSEACDKGLFYLLKICLSTIFFIVDAMFIGDVIFIILRRFGLTPHV